MKKLMPALALASLLAAPLARADGAPNYQPLLASHLVGPVLHSSVRDQADVGFCWAYAISGYMEGQALKKGHSVTLSPEYLALNHMPSLMFQFLPIFEMIDGQGFLARVLLDALIIPQISSEGSIGYSESLSDLDAVGMVPESVYKVKFPFTKNWLGEKAEVHPTLEEKVRSFVKAKLLNKENVQNYERDEDAFRRDFFDAIGIHPPKPTDTFVYEGIRYTPITFMREYLGFAPEAYQEVVIMNGQYQSMFEKMAASGLEPKDYPVPKLPVPYTGLSADQGLRLIQSQVTSGNAVPVAFVVFEDQKDAEKSGVFSPQNCDHGACVKTKGGHAVLITGVKDSPSIKGDPIAGLVIKNSWGTIGLNDHAQVTNNEAQRGFFVITPSYLQLAQNLAKSNGWSFLVPKAALPAK